MKSKIKKFINSKLFIFIITALVFSTIGVSATTLFPSNNVTYDNGNSGLQSTDVQGAIDELYTVCFPPPPAGDSILDDVPIVSSGNGLYKDTYEEGRYFYKGKNVNNYVTFNNEIWRIISIEPDKTIKIMREKSIGNQVWDSSNSKNWAHPASLNTYLNGTYLSGLNSEAQNQIVSKNWSIGAIKNGNDDLKVQISNESSSKWNGKVALPTVSEYIRSNSNQSVCGTHSKNDNNYSSCKNTTWMHNDTSWWTISPETDSSDGIFYVLSNGIVSIFGASYFDGAFDIRPAVYLSSEVQITGGDGSQSNPYTIK